MRLKFTGRIKGEFKDSPEITISKNIEGRNLPFKEVYNGICEAVGKFKYSDIYMRNIKDTYNKVNKYYKGKNHSQSFYMEVVNEITTDSSWYVVTDNNEFILTTVKEQENKTVLSVTQDKGNFNYKYLRINLYSNGSTRIVNIV